MEYKTNCNFCGQELTRDTGQWVVGMHYYGLTRRLPVRMCCCSGCMREVNEFMISLAERGRLRHGQGQAD